jgi:hypothetical protein
MIESIERRPGFLRLLAAVAFDRVGLILGREMSRLAGCCKDGHPLRAGCGRDRVLLADANGIDDPTEHSDRQRKRGVESTAPALWAGLEKLLALAHLLETGDGEQRRDLARWVLPKLFRSGEQSPGRKVAA